MIKSAIRAGLFGGPARIHQIFEDAAAQEADQSRPSAIEIAATAGALAGLAALTAWVWLKVPVEKSPEETRSPVVRK